MLWKSMSTTYWFTKTESIATNHNKMQKTLILLFITVTASFGVQAKKVPVHAWLGGLEEAIKASKNGATGICCSPAE